MNSSVKRFCIFLLLWAAALVLFNVLPYWLSISQKSVMISLMQIIVLLLLLLVVRRLSLKGQSIPSAVLLVALITTAVGALKEFGIIGLAEGSFVVSRLNDDPYEKKSRIFREKVSKLQQHYAYGKSPAVVARYYDRVENAAEAGDFLDNNHHIGGVLWERDRWWILSLANQPARELGSGFSELSFGELAGFKMIVSVAAIGVSKKPEGATALFLASLLDGISPLPGLLGTRNSVDYDRQEMALLAAGNQRAFWTSSAHLAYPWFVLGNLYLSDVLDNGYQSGKITCALNAYRNGLMLLRSRHDNPELRMALLNNSAAALILRATSEGKFVLLKEARRYLRLGLAAGRYSGPFKTWHDGWVVVNSNLWTLQRKRVVDKKNGVKKIGRGRRRGASLRVRRG